MSKKRYGSFKVGMTVILNGEEHTIMAKERGNKTNTPIVQGGIKTGFKSNPCLYTLSNGFKVRGSTLLKHKK